MSRSAAVAEQKNTVSFKEHLYATHGFTDPTTTSCLPATRGPERDELQELPFGWEIAPDEPEIVSEVIAKYHWGIQVLTLSSGASYNTKAQHGLTPGALYCTFNKDMITPWEKQYPVHSRGYGLLLRTSKPPTWSDRAESYRSEFLLDLGKRRKFTDCKICCHMESFDCHRSVLAQASPVFASMLAADMSEGQSQCIKIDDAEPDVVEAMVEFIYTGLFQVRSEDVASLITQADVYQIDALVRASAEHALEIIDVANAAVIARSMRPLASRPEGKQLFDKLLDKLKSDNELLTAVVLGS